jgi:hypothetical protein
VDVLVVDLVRAANTPCVPVIGIAKHLKSLVDKDVMYHKVSKTVGENPEAYGQASPKTVILPRYKATNTHYRVKDEKGIVTFPPAFVILHVMVLVKHPQETVHDVFVGEPGHEFHNTESGQENHYPKHCLHDQRTSFN